MRAYIWVCRNDVSHYTVIDLEHLPSGATSHFLEEFRVQGTVITEWLRMDLDRAVATVERINARDYGEDALRLVSHLASFAENAPPADEPRDTWGAFDDLLARGSHGTPVGESKPHVSQEVLGQRGADNAGDQVMERQQKRGPCTGRIGRLLLRQNGA